MHIIDMRRMMSAAAAVAPTPRTTRHRPNASVRVGFQAAQAGDTAIPPFALDGAVFAIA